jgi:hypothetical protein
MRYRYRAQWLDETRPVEDQRHFLEVLPRSGVLRRREARERVRFARHHCDFGRAPEIGAAANAPQVIDREIARGAKPARGVSFRPGSGARGGGFTCRGWRALGGGARKRDERKRNDLRDHPPHLDRRPNDRRRPLGQGMRPTCPTVRAHGRGFG